MNTLKHKRYRFTKSLLTRLMLSLMIGLSANTSHAAIAQVPLFLTTSAKPIVMLNISKDHQLYFKAFDDYSDLDKDGIPETTYKHSIDYYGYFDSYKCYSYVNNEFEPTLTTSTKYCSTGLWSGNFLNWASMARIDSIRKILYGGLRQTDIGGITSTTSTSSTTPVVGTPVVTHPVTTVGPASGSSTPAAVTTNPAGTTLTQTSLKTATATNTATATATQTTAYLSSQPATTPTYTGTIPAAPVAPIYTGTIPTTPAAPACTITIPAATGPTITTPTFPATTVTYSTPSTTNSNTNNTSSSTDGPTIITTSIDTATINTYANNAAKTTVTPVSISASTTVTPTANGSCTTSVPVVTSVGSLTSGPIVTPPSTYTSRSNKNSSGDRTYTYTYTLTWTYTYTFTYTWTYTQPITNKTSVTTNTNTSTTTVTTGTQTAVPTSTTTYTTTTANLGTTVLERSYLPNDAHSFAKFYNGPDLNQLTPYTSAQVANGITLCNTTVSSTTLSQNVTDAPLIRVAMGDYSLWSANERWQCRWLEDTASDGSPGSTTNGNVTSSSGLSASAVNPSNHSSGSGDFIARVKVCVNGLVNTENCKTYPDGTLKPIGLLQTYGDGDLIRFGLLTGSYGKNKSGGVLRKNASSITDEIYVSTNGTFKPGGIINTLNILRIYGYRHDDGTYFNTSGSDNCSWGLTSFTDGNCSNWGNPQSEIFLESLRYLSNHSALPAYLPTSPRDSSYISGLTVATPTNPIIDTEWCAKLNVIQFNASTSSYDGDQLGNVADISATAMNSLTNKVGVGENIPGNSYFVGENGTINNQLCTAKTVNNLSDVRGTCPDAPRLSGSYHIAGLAQFAHNNDIELTLQGNQLVTAYGVALSPAIPKIVIPVPGSASKTVTILPACQDSSLPGNCAIVDFKIVHRDCSLVSSPVSSPISCGKVYVNWEDSEQGGDFDQDEWGTLTYSVSSTQVKITTDVIAQSTPYSMGFGYILSGTTKDGFHAHSGINGYAYTDPQPGVVTSGVNACTNCASTDAATTVTYTIGSSSALSLQQPLYYAAKWGGFIDSNNNGIPDLPGEWDSNGDGIPDRYFFATDPGELANSLRAALDDVIKTSASASAVSANSTRLDTGTQVYQAKFSSSDWSGQLQAYSVNASTGALTPVWEASALLPAQGSRNIYTYNPSAAAGSRGVLFQWTNLTATPVGASQQDYLNTLAGVNDGNGALRVNWLRGDDAKETKNTGGIFRNRTNFLGDIINSDPFYVGIEDYGYGTLPGAEGSSYSDFRATSAYLSRRPMLYLGANEGMFHGFDANSTATGGQEVFAYIPNVLFPELSKLTSPGYVHEYYVDGMSGVGDVYYTSAWHTLLAGTTGAGARAVFALDVTNPDGFGASSALWEFTNANDVDLGYTLAQPSVVRMQDGHWAVIVANGYNSDNGRAVLFVLDAKTGAVLQKIVTPTTVGTTAYPNGLSSPIAVDTNNDHSVDTVYAGDLYGNLWKFDMSGSAGSWSTPSSPLFVACATSGATCSATDRQPITGKPNVGKVGAAGTDQNGEGRMIYFGTGKYFEKGDNGASPQVQTFYGLWDIGPAITDRAKLQEQTIIFEGFATTVGGAQSTNPIRVVSKNPVCYATTSTGCTASSPLKSGWALNLLSPIKDAEGERVVSFPLVRRGLVVFSTLIPNAADPCTNGGKSWLMEISVLGGGEFGGGSPFDVNGDGVVNAEDFVTIAGIQHAVSGIDKEIGITKTPAVVESTSVDFKYLSGSTGQISTVVDTGGGGGGGGSGIRRSWRQLK